MTADQYKDQRTSKVTILDFILSQIDEAVVDLPWIAKKEVDIDQAFAGLKARAALLGGSLDYGGKAKDYFTIAAAAAKSVIGQRALAANYDDLFTKAGQAKTDVRNETLFELMYSDQELEIPLGRFWFGFKKLRTNRSSPFSYFGGYLRMY